MMPDGATVRDALAACVGARFADTVGERASLRDRVAATAADAQEVCHAIREALRADFGDATADATRILYGGSAKPGNIKELMAQADVDGALIGGASLKADSFSEMANFYA